MSSSPSDPDSSAADELREGITHLFAAARKALQQAEPHIVRGLIRAEETLTQVSEHGGDVGRELASIASRFMNLFADPPREETPSAEGADGDAQPASAGSPSAESESEDSHG